MEHSPRASAPPLRTLIVLDPAAASSETLAAALGISGYEAGLLVARAAPLLHRVLEAPEAADEVARLRKVGLTAISIPESEARVPVLPASGGEIGGGRLLLRTEDGLVGLEGGDLLLLVTGSIVRERQAEFDRRAPAAGRLDEGWRVHLHRLKEERPIEIDAAHFEPGFTRAGSTRIEIEACLREAAPDTRRDDGFRHLVPALAPAAPAPPSRLSALDSLHANRRDSVMLDNVAQFRFYSGWRAAFERRRRAGSGVGPPAPPC